MYQYALFLFFFLFLVVSNYYIIIVIIIVYKIVNKIKQIWDSIQSVNSA
jgi:uncharacterized protein Yka (UPF0111/DUF47 family)